MTSQDYKEFHWIRFNIYVMKERKEKRKKGKKEKRKKERDTESVCDHV